MNFPLEDVSFDSEELIKKMKACACGTGQLSKWLKIPPDWLQRMLATGRANARVLERAEKLLLKKAEKVEEPVKVKLNRQSTAHFSNRMSVASLQAMISDGKIDAVILKEIEQSKKQPRKALLEFIERWEGED